MLLLLQSQDWYTCYILCTYDTSPRTFLGSPSARHKAILGEKTGAKVAIFVYCALMIMTMRWVATVALTIIRRKEWHVMARHLLSRYAVCVPRHGDMPSWWHAQSVDFFGGKVIWVDPTNKRGLNKSYQFGPKLHWYETIETLPHPTLLEIMVKRCSQCEIHRESRSYKTGPTWRITSEYGNRTSEMFRYIYIQYMGDHVWSDSSWHGFGASPIDLL